MDEKKADSECEGAPSQALLVVHLLRRVESERRAVEHELHDAVSGMLAAARMDMSFIRARAGAAAELSEHFARADGAIDRAIKSTRKIMQGLRPALLDHFGLPVALKHHVDETCRGAAVTCSSDMPEEIAGLEPELQMAAFRVVEELLGDGSGLAAFDVKLHAAVAAWNLRITMRGSAGASDRDRRPGAAALRVWIEACGGEWAAQRDGLQTTISLSLPCKI